MTAMLQKDKRILLLCGGPGVGKSAMVRRLASLVERRSIAGFYTAAHYENQQRVGFKVVNFNGKEAVVAHINTLSPVRVGRYGVDVALLDDMMLSAFASMQHAAVVFIDELGKLEVKSAIFGQKLDELLTSRAVLIISSPLRGPAILEKIKARDDVVYLRVAEHSTQQVADFAQAWLVSHLES